MDSTDHYFNKDIWLAKSNWDDEVDSSTKQEWLTLRADFQNVKDLRIDRWLETDKKSKIQLHGFSDASMNAYAAAVYIRVENSDGSIKTKLIAAKTRVAPVKTISLPRLELCGALLLSKLMSQVADAMREPTSNMFAWTDSSITVGSMFSHSIIQQMSLPEKEQFETEIQNVKIKKTVNKKSKLKRLNPYLDEDGILRVGGRLRHSDLQDHWKHPIILGDKSILTSLIVADAHMKTLHGGVQLMLTYLQNRFWIIKAKGLVKSYIYKCLICARYNAIPRTQLMGDLPKERVTRSRPFLHSGVDFAGPINVLMSKGRGAKTTKAYIAIFVCLSTKAIHLELAGDLTSETFIGAFKRFVSRRGKCTHLWSDQGRNFVGANKDLLTAWQEANLQFNKLAESLALDGTQWHFIPAYSPNFGGLWEAGVKSIKYHMKRILTTYLTFEEMTTVLCQIEAVLNSRPISTIDDDIDNIRPLTPGNFLIGEAPIVVPGPSLENAKIHSLTRWQHTQKLVGDFWRRWQNEYLARLQQRPKWLKEKKDFENGDIVLIKTDGLSPGKWSLGRIVNKHPGADNLTRVYSVKSGDNITKRSITQLCAMPIDTKTE
ncbi:uncharacterized protein LOC125075518 [Vanessa atalanta]|uniref:uncharacterized protein LOC125075502 n=1 Tax=Vanessa atalanta TaxID=42275 RepID=UPI001FCD2866|nr:uncharacterized protein LOC125075502 [Vanessa atalanta]XP_047543189.1 uncharacterized protein LOC125075518 [Vanessa atalanta]